MTTDATKRLHLERQLLAFDVAGAPGIVLDGPLQQLRQGPKQEFEFQHGRSLCAFDGYLKPVPNFSYQSLIEELNGMLQEAFGVLELSPMPRIGVDEQLSVRNVLNHVP